ncbi:MAG: leucine-rich repeat protein, partial [Pseudobutyrivibrio sp.]|nr:leucine-rich repeat protein [Pseudobutyrivibrio sp.]
YAFNKCTSLESIVLPQKVSVIGQLAFANCTSLSDIVIPASVKTLGYAAFYKSGLESVQFSGNNIEFSSNWSGSETFSECVNLKEISLPSNVSYIPGQFLYNCRSLKKVVLGPKIKTIGSDAFAKDDLAYFYVQKGTATEKALKAYGISADRIVSMNGITYNLNKGVLNGYCPSVYSKQDGAIQIADPTRENYKFAGWFTDASFKKSIGTYANGVTTIDVSNQSGNITLYAKWDGPIYTVTLNPGVNATVAITSMEVYKNSTYGKYNDNTDKELPVPSATGKTFKGWFTADGDLVTADTKVTDEAKDQVLYAKYKNNVDTVEAPELLDSNGLTVLPTDEKTDITKFYFKSATADATIIYTVKAENVAASENTYSDGFALEAGKTYTITAYATKEKWTDSPKNTWTVTVVDSVSAEDTPDLYKPEYEGKFWVVFQGAIYDETKVSTVYTGANVKLSGYQVYYGKKLLEENKDYKVSYKNNKKIAKYDEVNKKGASIAPTMIITGKGNTKGKLELRFNIEGNEDAVKLTNSNTTFELSESVFDYDGTAHTPEVKNLQIKATKKTEAVAIDAKSYTVSYEKNVAAGTAKVVVTFDGKE